MKSGKKPSIKEILEQGPDSELENEYSQENITAASLFIKVGILVLSIIMMISLGIRVIPDAVTVTNTGSKRDLPIYCVDTPDKKVALSFEAAWGNEDTKKILDTLTKHNVKVTFFMTGGWVDKYPEDVKAIHAAGHDLGNHSENHKQMTELTREQCIEEIVKVHDKVKKLTGIEMNLFRAPYGEYNNTLVGAARDSGYTTIQWNVDSQDWKDYGTESIVKTVLNNKHLGNGSIILLHTGTKYTPDALEGIITGLKEQGYELVPISQLIYTKDYTIDQTGRQFKK